jgi:glycosyltransferase involved in cell wall biosynthesis
VSTDHLEAPPGSSEAPPVRRTLPLSAVVASRNEARELARCLRSLSFCDELIVIDLESEDETAAVAEAHGARVVPHELVPIAEYARIDVVPTARHDWLLFTDPDEEIAQGLAEELAQILPRLADDVAIVWAPIRFYFGERPLRGTIWGGENRRRLLVRRDRVDLTPTVFGGTRPRPGFGIVELPFTEETAIRHHWVSGYRDWVRKHRRYLTLEAADRACAGEVTGVRAVLERPWRSFYDCFVTRAGYHDGATGFCLSVLWAAYSTAAEVALLRRLRR